MTVRVQDSEGREIKVGTRCVYGGDPTQVCEVVAISDPDVLYNPETDTDDGGYAVDITARFPDGETEAMQAKILSSSYSYGTWEVDEAVFEEPGDLEVIQ